MIDYVEFSRLIRLKALDMCHKKRTSHIGGAFSVADILAVLYGGFLNVDPDAPCDPERDRVFYSKGHACTALYAALGIRGFFNDADLLTDFTRDGSYFTSHVNHRVPGVELSTGSLGHALGVACGCAVALQEQKRSNLVVTILSDGELDEGSNWEAILFAAHHRLDNLVAIVDYNKIQSFGAVEDIMNLEPLADKFRSFNWEVEQVDGHNHVSVQSALARFRSSHSRRPKCLIAHTVKGKGVDFMEGRLAWHYQSPSDDEYRRARMQLELFNA